ncbi:MAG: hypothetical protein R6V01_02265 [Thermoplasmatota archaeon]
MSSELPDLSGIGTSLIGREIEHVEDPEKVKERMNARVEDGAAEGLVVIGGIVGDRSIEGLRMCLLLRPKIAPGQASVLPLISALCISKAVSTSAFIETGTVWPGNVVMEEEIAATVVHEASSREDDLEYVVLDMKIDPSGSISRDLKVDAFSFLKDLLIFLDMHYVSVKEGEIEQLLDKWTERCSMIGEKVRIRTSDGSVSGTVLGIDQTGGLVIKDHQEMKRVDMEQFAGFV